MDLEFEYRIFIDKKETVPNEPIVKTIQNQLPNSIVERQSTTEIVFGIRRNQSKMIPGLIRTLDAKSEEIGVDSYGLSMTTIEEVFLKYE